MDFNPGRRLLFGGQLGLREKGQMQLVLLRGKSRRQLRDHLLGTAATKMRYQKQKLWRRIHDSVKTSKIAASIKVFPPLCLLEMEFSSLQVHGRSRE